MSPTGSHHRQLRNHQLLYAYIALNYSLILMLAHRTQYYLRIFNYEAAVELNTMILTVACCLDVVVVPRCSLNHKNGAILFINILVMPLANHPTTKHIS